MGDLNFFTAFKLPRTTHQQKKYTKRGIVYEPANLSEARATFEAYLAGSIPPVTFKGALQVTLIFSYQAKDQKQVDRPKATRPDADNLAKLPLDVMTKLGYWLDDGQICDLRVVKRYDKAEGLGVLIHEL